MLAAANPASRCGPDPILRQEGLGRSEYTLARPVQCDAAHHVAALRNPAADVEPMTMIGLARGGNAATAMPPRARRSGREQLLHFVDQFAKMDRLRQHLGVL